MKSSSIRVLQQGLIAGLIGYLVVAIVFAVASVATGESPFHTAAVLGATLFYGATDPAAITVTPAYVFAFNGLHMVVFLGFGAVGAWLSALATKGPQLWYFSLFFWMLVAAHIIGAAQVFALPLEGTVSGGAVWGAGIGAAILMAAYLYRANPALHAKEAW